MKAKGSFTVAVAGVSGYAGGELLRLLAKHPQVQVKTVAGYEHAGKTLSLVQPQLFDFGHLTIQETTVENLTAHDIVFFALPQGISAQLAKKLPKSTLVIDAGADFRLESEEQWDKFYNANNTMPYAGAWAYGLPELPEKRRELSRASRIAIPGCYPTSILLALAPGFAAGMLDPEDLVVVSASGVSGAGRKASTHLLGSEVMGAMSSYGAGGVHRHIPEIEQELSKILSLAQKSSVSASTQKSQSTSGNHDVKTQDVRLCFTPTLAPMPRGILSTVVARLKPGVSASRLRDTWEEYYRDEPFAHMLNAGQWPSTKMVASSNHAAIQLAYDRHVNRVVVSAVIDNLVKGTAGGAVQAMNVALGIPETTGLEGSGVAP